MDPLTDGCGYALNGGATDSLGQAHGGDPNEGGGEGGVSVVVATVCNPTCETAGKLRGL